MANRRTNISDAEFTQGTNGRGEPWASLDLSGEHLGVRVEELAPGTTSSYHHYHTLEEEHVLVLSGTAILHLGSAEHELGEGDHVWFAAGEQAAHHIHNQTSETFRFLVFGERKDGDVVVYPEGQVMLVRALGNRQFTYRDRVIPTEPSSKK
jgi:uncharacterized cupin superfamily protein